MKSNIPNQKNKPEPKNPIMSKIPKEMQNMGKFTAFMQLICFLVIFLGIYLLLRTVVHSTVLRILILVADYIVTALFTYLVIRPAALKIEAKMKKK